METFTRYFGFSCVFWKHPLSHYFVVAILALPQTLTHAWITGNDSELVASLVYQSNVVSKRFFRTANKYDPSHTRLALYY